MLNPENFSDQLAQKVALTASHNPFKDGLWPEQPSDTQELAQSLGNTADAISVDWIDQWLEEEDALTAPVLPQELDEDSYLGDRYEVLDGTLLKTSYPCWAHQEITGRLFYVLDMWTRSNQYGRVAISPCLRLGGGDRLIPDVVWVSPSRFDALMDSRGQLTGVPELVVEVLSPGGEDERCDRQLKLKIYSREGVKEYWIVDPVRQQIQVYCREEAVLSLAATYQRDEILESRLLPNCICSLDTVFA